MKNNLSFCFLRDEKCVYLYRDLLVIRHVESKKYVKDVEPNGVFDVDDGEILIKH
jgi:hypothetical protein